MCVCAFQFQKSASRTCEKHQKSVYGSITIHGDVVVSALFFLSGVFVFPSWVFFGCSGFSLHFKNMLRLATKLSFRCEGGFLSLQWIGKLSRVNPTLTVDGLGSRNPTAQDVKQVQLNGWMNDFNYRGKSCSLVLLCWLAAAGLTKGKF